MICLSRGLSYSGMLKFGIWSSFFFVRVMLSVLRDSAGLDFFLGSTVWYIVRTYRHKLYKWRLSLGVFSKVMVNTYSRWRWEFLSIRVCRSSIDGHSWWGWSSPSYREYLIHHTFRIRSSNDGIVSHCYFDIVVISIVFFIVDFVVNHYYVCLSCVFSCSCLSCGGCGAGDPLPDAVSILIPLIFSGIRLTCGIGTIFHNLWAQDRVVGGWFTDGVWCWFIDV